MREFAFAFEYEAGADPVMDVFREAPRLRSESVVCVATESHTWRLDRVTGPSGVLDDLETVYTDPSFCNDCVGPARCDADPQYWTVDLDDEQRLFYALQPADRSCRSVPRLAARYLGPGVLFHAVRREDRYAWNLLMPDDGKVGLLYDTIHEKLRDGLAFRMGHLRDAEGWPGATRPSLPPAQRAAVEAAVERGYYETPRETTVEGLADELDVPRSTLSYRLRRAEAQLATGFVG